MKRGISKGRERPDYGFCGSLPPFPRFCPRTGFLCCRLHLVLVSELGIATAENRKENRQENRFQAVFFRKVEFWPNEE